jgi:hypothetical protein
MNRRIEQHQQQQQDQAQVEDLPAAPDVGGATAEAEADVVKGGIIIHGSLSTPTTSITDGTSNTLFFARS